jgi:hypothetical protein
MWLVAFESMLSLFWVLGWALVFLFAAIGLFVPGGDTLVRLASAWGVAMAVVCTVQVAFALAIDSRYDARTLRAFLLGPLYPLFFWAISALAALREQMWALIRGPAGSRVVWDLSREPADTAPH